MATDHAERLLVEGGDVDVCGIEPGDRETAVRCRGRERRVVFAPTEPLLLDRGDDRAVDEQCSGSIVKSCAEAEDHRRAAAIREGVAPGPVRHKATLYNCGYDLPHTGGKSAARPNQGPVGRNYLPREGR